MGKHTPGPWDTDTGGDVTAADGTTLLTREQPFNMALGESFANAELAALAPDLLEALQAAASWAMPMDEAPKGLRPEWFDKARAVLARAQATGEPE